MSDHKPTLFLAIIAAITSYIKENDQSYNDSPIKYKRITRDIFYQNKKSSKWKEYIRPYKLPSYSYYQQKTIQNPTTQLSLLQLRKWKLYNS